MTNPIVEQLWDRIDTNLIEHGEAAEAAAGRAESSAARAESAAEEAEVGVRDDTVGRRHLTPELRDEVDGKATTEAVDAALAEKADTGHTHTAAEVGARPDDWVPTPGQVGAATPSYVDSQVATRATPAEVDGRIETIIGTAPENLDTLGEIADKLAEQDDVASALTTQIAEKASKEHTHTASDVGARPDTWTPTASDVGARPDDWAPTAEQVGAATPDYVDSRVREVTGDDWPTDPVPGVIYWQGE